MTAMDDLSRLHNMQDAAREAEDVVLARLREKIRLISESKVILADNTSRREISQRVQELFNQTQAIPGIQDITQEDINAGIEAYRREE